MRALANVHLIGLSANVGVKLLYTAVLLVGVFVLRRLARALVRLVLRGRRNETTRFWTRQGINVATALCVLLGFLSIWFDKPSRLATAVGLVSAGLAFALQKVVTSAAGYLLILRGNIFTIGDRIVMGGVRGDVIGLDFLRTTILEMGEPPDAAPDGGDTGSDTSPSWVAARQYTGRIVTVANASVFDDPVYNYTRDFPYLWEELRIPIGYDADRAAAETILLDAAAKHTVDLSEMSAESLERMRRRYFVPTTDLEPEVFYRLTDNWLELSVRFVVRSHDIRQLKSNMSRDILDGFERAGITIASSTYDIVGLPPIRFAEAGPNRRRRSRNGDATSEPAPRPAAPARGAGASARARAASGPAARRRRS